MRERIEKIMDPNTSNRQNASTQTSKELSELTLQSKKMRKRLLIVLCGVLASILLLSALIGVLGLLFPTQQEAGDLGGAPPKISFDKPYQGDIFEYEAYLALYPEVVRYVSESGLGISISEDSDRSFDDTVWYLCDFLDIMRHGDVEAYNACFNEHYYASHAPQKPFSQQMIYDAEISLVKTGTASNGDTLKTYQLMYKLLQNDGSLRTDVGRNLARPQYVVLRENDTVGITVEDLYYN